MKKLVCILASIAMALSGTAQTVQWGLSFADRTTIFSQLMVVDSSDNIINIGYLTDGSTNDFDPGPGQALVTGNANANYGYIHKLKPDGTFDWVVTLEGDDNCAPLGVLADGDDNLYISGVFQGNLDLDPGPAQSLVSSTNQQTFVVKLDSNGTFVWGKQFTTVGGGFGAGVVEMAWDGTGNLVLAGTQSSTTDYDPGAGVVTHPQPGGTSVLGFLARLDRNGDYVSSFIYGEGNQFYVQQLTVDNSNGVYVTAEYIGSVDVDPGPGTLAFNAFGQPAHLFIKYDLSGNLQWGYELGMPQNIAAVDLEVDPVQRCLLLVSVNGTVDVDPTPGVYNFTASVRRPLVLKMSPSGGLIGMDSIPPDVDVTLRDLAVDEQGNIYMAGQATMDFDLDPGQDTFPNPNDIERWSFIRVTDSLGNYLWSAATEFGIPTPLGYIFKIGLQSGGRVATMGVFGNPMELVPGSSQNTLSTSFFSSVFVATYLPGFCNGLFLTVDSLEGVACSSPGHLRVRPQGGVAPFSYSWVNYPALTDSFTSVLAPAIETITVTDASNCTFTGSYVIPGPTFTTGVDLDANMTATEFRPGFPGTIYIDVTNLGCIPGSGTVVLEMDSNLIYVSANPTPASVNGNTITWNTPPMTYDSANFVATVQYVVDTMAELGGIVCLDLDGGQVVGDVNIFNNLTSFCNDIIGSYDPNDKRGFPQGVCPPNYVEIDQQMTYAIRFQNTGNADAINVLIKDSISPNLDLSTFKVVGQSHPGLVVEVVNGYELNFRFDDIHLPDSTTDPMGSQGYVMFEIDPIAGLTDGTEIRNKVGIIFDVNAPVITNEVLHTFVNTVPQFDLGVVENGGVLTANQAGAIYQWIDCASGQPIPGATGQSFTPSAMGQYAVEVEQGACIGMSSCVNVLQVGISDQLLPSLKVFPNPTTGRININFGEFIAETELTILDLSGRELVSQQVRGEGDIIIDLDLPDGLYLLRIRSLQGEKTLKVELVH